MATRKSTCPDCLLPPEECLGHDDDASDPMGVIVIEWSAPPGPLPGWGLKIFDAVTGQQIKTCLNMEVHCDAAGAVTAGLTLFADEDGKPILDGTPVADDSDDGVLTGVFPFEVGEMRVRS